MCLINLYDLPLFKRIITRDGENNKKKYKIIPNSSYENIILFKVYE